MWPGSPCLVSGDCCGATLSPWSWKPRPASRPAPQPRTPWLQLGQPRHGYWTQPVSSTQADAPEKMQALGGKQPSDSVPDLVAHVSRRRPRPLVQPQTHPHAAFRDATRRWGLDTQVVLLVPPVPVCRATMRAPVSPGGGWVCPALLSGTGLMTLVPAALVCVPGCGAGVRFGEVWWVSR